MPSRHTSILSLVTLLLCACASHQAQLAVFSQAADSSEPAPVPEPVPGSPEPPAPTQLAAAEAVQGILVSGLIQHPPVDFWQQLQELPDWIMALYLGLVLLIFGATVAVLWWLFKRPSRWCCSSVRDCSW